MPLIAQHQTGGWINSLNMVDFLNDFIGQANHTASIHKGFLKSDIEVIRNTHSENRPSKSIVYKLLISLI